AQCGPVPCATFVSSSPRWMAMVYTVTEATSGNHEGQRPAPTPAGVLIRLVREAAGKSIPASAAAVRERGGRVSIARWSQIESGSELRRTRYRTVRANPGTLAHMAAVLGITPERLATEGGRPDAAAVLAEMQRSDERAALLDEPDAGDLDEPFPAPG